MPEGSTIAALATAPLPAGVAVIRISGEKSAVVLRALFKSKRSPIKHPREMIFGDVINFTSGDVIDRGLAVFMPAPRSYTGEDTAEIHVHGSPLLVQRILRSLYAFGVSPAEPGEFTKRAFLNGKLDLVQAEAIAELIQASSDRSLVLAGEQLEGKLSQALDEIGEPLRNMLAEIEAQIDFPDEDIEPARIEEMQQELKEIEAKIAALISTYSYGQTVKEGLHVLLCGRPNVGKSSLLNLLLGNERAIVTPVSGTTRDLLEEQGSIAGFKFIFCDSAGICDSDDEVEKIGVELAKSKISWADLVLLVVDASDTSDYWKQLREYLKGKARKIWLVTNKLDLNPAAVGVFTCDSSTCSQSFYVSAKTRDGLDELMQALVEEVKLSLPDYAEASGVVTNERHISCLSKAAQSLRRVSEAIRQALPSEIISAELHAVLANLEEIVGKTYNEDILGRIFSKFCIGK